jgi:hypothetical protein
MKIHFEVKPLRVPDSELLAKKILEPELSDLEVEIQRLRTLKNQLGSLG